MIRSAFCSIVLACSAAFLLAAPPNVVLIITDDQGYGDLACHGSKAVRTPALDALHKESVRLTDFHVSPTCSPTRAALLSGKNPTRIGVWHTISGRSFLREGERLLPEFLAAAGYATGIFGKWHLGDNFPNRPQDHGYQECLTHGGGGVGQTPDVWGNDYQDDFYRRGGVPEQQTGYCTDVWFGAATKWIESVKDRPFFCHIATNAPHSPYIPPPNAPAPRENPEVLVPQFVQMIENIDQNVGNLMQFLKTNGLYENTLVVFLTDNGTAAGTDEHGQTGFNARMRARKGSPYDGGHRVPCFLRWPAGKIGGGRDVTELTAHYDLTPTLAEACGVKLPEDFVLDGKSLLPLLRGETTAWPERTIIIDNQRILQPMPWRQTAVLTPQWRLINGRELYDIKADPSQRHDLSAQQPAVLEDLRQRYLKWWEEVSPSFATDARITLGNDAENPTKLTAHDWQNNEGTCPWDQTVIRAGKRGNGPWAVRIDRDGIYEFTLRRWPFGVDRPVEDGYFKIAKARLHIGNQDAVKDFPAGAKEITFRLTLKAGPTKLQTWFEGESGESSGAYFVQAKRLTEAELAAEAEAAKPKKKSKGKAKAEPIPPPQPEEPPPGEPEPITPTSDLKENE